jgi:hypothetical protein
MMKVRERGSAGNTGADTPDVCTNVRSKLEFRLNFLALMDFAINCRIIKSHVAIKGFSMMSQQQPDPPGYLTDKITLPVENDATQPNPDRHITHPRTPQDASLHRRITRPLRQQGKRGERLKALRLEADRQREKPTLPEASTEPADRGAFSFGYILERLNRCICQAQDSGNYREAIRLQMLQWYMQDRRLSPVQVARKAWLHPAAH